MPSPARRAGLLVPLFSIRPHAVGGLAKSAISRPCASWLERAGQRVLLMLPINEMPVTESSPYSALSAMAIDPQFITVADVEDFAAIGGEGALEPESARATVSCATRGAGGGLCVGAGAASRWRCVARSRHFQGKEWKSDTSARGPVFRAYVDEAGRWLDDYALFRALNAHPPTRLDGLAEPIRHRCRGAHPRTSRADEVRYRKDVQWLAGEAVDRGARPEPAVSHCLGTCHSWSAATARTSGRDRTSSSGVVGRRAAGRVQRDRAGLGTSGLQVGRARRTRFRLAQAATPTETEGTT